jgi:nicotinamide riboside kinase
MSVGFIIAVLGAEATGKSELSRALAQRIAQHTGLSATWVPEALRAFCHQHARTPQRDEQADIARAQDQAIAQASREHDVVVADTTSIMTAIYSEHYFNDTSLMAPALAMLRTANATLLCATDLPWQADGIQRDSPSVQQTVSAKLRQTLMAHGIGHSLVSGAGAARVESAMDAVAPSLRSLPTPKRGLFTRLDQRNAEGSAQRWRCENCDDPDCEHALQLLGRKGPPG